MKLYQKSIYISSTITFLVVAIIPLATLFGKLPINYIISAFAILGITLAYLISTLRLIKASPEDQKGKFGVLNPAINSIAIISLFSCFFLMDKLQDTLYYNLGIGVRYIQSPMFTIVFPAILFFIIGIIGHMVVARKSQSKLA
jgi:hypothetical protein